MAKGKFVDRNNKISDIELNIEAQKAALETWNAVGKESEPVYKMRSKNAKNESKVALKKMLKPMSLTFAKQLQKAVKGRTPTPTSQPAMKGFTKPVNQLPEGSSLAKMLGAGKRKASKKSRPKSKGSEESSGSDSASLDSEEDSSEEQTSEDSDDGDSSPSSSDPNLSTDPSESSSEESSSESEDSPPPKKSLQKDQEVY